MPRRYANGHISATGDPIHFMFGSRVGFQGRRIEWRYFRLHQIQVGGRPPSWIISNGHISATAYSIHLYSSHRVHRAFIFAIAQLSCLKKFPSGIVVGQRTSGLKIGNARNVRSGIFPVFINTRKPCCRKKTARCSMFCLHSMTFLLLFTCTLYIHNHKSRYECETIKHDTAC